MSRSSFHLLGVQIPVVTTLLTALTAGGITLLAVQVATSTLRQSALTELSSIIDERATVIQDYAARLSADLHVMVEDTGFQRALRTFDNLIGDDTSPGSAAALAREQYDPRFNTIVREKHFSDLLLIDEKRRVAYSTSHRFEGKTFEPGPMAAPLAKALDQALAAKTPGVVTFADFAGAPQRAYVVQALPDVNGGWLGVLVVELDMATVSSVFNAPVGATGAVTLAAADGEPRSVARVGSAMAGERLSKVRPLQFFDQSWTLTGSVALSEVEAPATAMQRVVLGAMLLLLGLSSLVMILYMRTRLSTPIRAMMIAMQRLANGDVDTPIRVPARRDEIADMAKSLAVFRDAAIENRRLQAAAEELRHRAEQDRMATVETAIASERAVVLRSLGTSLGLIAAADLRARIDGAIPQAYLQIQHDFNVAIGQMDLAVGKVAEAAGSITSSTQVLDEGSQELSRHIEANAANLEETSAALADIARTIQRAASDATRADQMVEKTRQTARESGTIIVSAMAAMEKIERSSREIGQIITVVDEIAFQTNLLALNAGVEAARAGDAGRGFAVVASEVRALAQRSAESAKQVKDLISIASRNVSEGVELVGSTRASLVQIIEHADDATRTVQKIATQAKDQASAIGEIDTAISRMSEATQQSAAMVEETAAAIANLFQEAADLSARVGEFRCTGGQRAASPARAQRVA